MAISLADYIATAPQRDAIIEGMERCASCGVALQETIAGYRRTKAGAKCSDCYFDALGELVETHPIGRPKALRGTIG